MIRANDGTKMGHSFKWEAQVSNQAQLIRALLVATLWLGMGSFLWAAGTETASRTALTVSDKKALVAKYAMLIGSHQFDEMEKITSQLLSQYQVKAISGDLLLAHMQAMVPDNGKGMLSDLEEWRRQKPKSYAANCVLGIQYFQLGASARGGAWTKDTSSDKMAEMSKYMLLAEDTLWKSVPLFAKPYPSYSMLINVAARMGTKDAQKAALNKVIRFDSDAVGVYQKYILYHTPRWGGDYGEIDKIVEFAKKTPMAKANIAILEAYVLACRAEDEEDLHQNPAGAIDFWIDAYQRNPGKKQVSWLYSAAKDARAAKQIDRAIQIYSRIVTDFKDEELAFFMRGVIYHEDKQDYKKAFDDSLSSAALGNRSAQNNVGYYYMTGKGVPKNLELAKKYFKLSADQGFEHAKEKLKLLEAGQVPP